MKAIFTRHAEESLLFRKIKKVWVKKAVSQPDLVLPAQEGKKAYYKDMGVNYLKVVVAEEGGNLVVITTHWVAKSRVKN